MATNFPTSIQDLDATRGTSGQTLASPNHITHHQTEDDTIEALQAKVGADSSAVTTSHDYKLSGVTGSDKAASKTGTETLTNKTLTSPKINVGSDATGDMYYRDSGGNLARIAAGADGTVIKYTSGIPAPASGGLLTNDQADALAGTSGTPSASNKFVTADDVSSAGSSGKIVRATGTALPALSGANLTNLPESQVFKSSVTTRDLTTASGNQTIAHGLGKTPKLVKFSVILHRSTNQPWLSFGSYDGTNNSCIVTTYNGTTPSSGHLTTACILVANDNDMTLTGGNTQYATATFDGTNITLAWTKVGTPTGTARIMWEAYS